MYFINHFIFTYVYHLVYISLLIFPIYVSVYIYVYLLFISLCSLVFIVISFIREEDRTGYARVRMCSWLQCLHCGIDCIQNNCPLSSNIASELSLNDILRLLETLIRYCIMPWTCRFSVWHSQQTVWFVAFNANVTVNSLTLEICAVDFASRSLSALLMKISIHVNISPLLHTQTQCFCLLIIIKTAASIRHGAKLTPKWPYPLAFSTYVSSNL